MQRTRGTIVGGRYLLTSRIAGGGMGEVWRASDEVLQRAVAVKLLRATVTDDPSFLERFRLEARNAARLSHGNIAQVYDYGEDQGSAFLVLELVDGRPLSHLISESAPIAEVDVVHLLVQAATALHAAHVKGIVHRDVKPANIVVDDESVAKLTDFGIARALDASSLTRAGEVMGTPQYLAPEAAVGKEATPQSDIYALGVVAYELLVGTLPYTSDTAVGFALAHVNEPVPTLPDTVSAPLRAVVEAALAKRPADRPRGGTDFARRLQEAVAAPAVSGVGPVAVAHLPRRRPEAPDDGADLTRPVPSPAHTPAPPRTLARGQNAVLSTHRITVGVEAAGDLRVDLIACALGAGDRATGEDALVFYNQPQSADGLVRLTSAGRIELDTAALPDDVRSVAVGVAIDPPQTLGSLPGLRTTVSGHGSGDGSSEPETFQLSAEFADERAALLVVFYRRGEEWKLRNASAGWQSGLSALVRSFGIEVAES